MSERDDLDEVRRDLLAQRGIDPLAAKLIGGTTLDEIESSVDSFAKLLDASGDLDGQESTTGAGVFADLAAGKAHRKRELAALFGGETSQPRDDSGRFA